MLKKFVDGLKMEIDHQKRVDSFKKYIFEAVSDGILTEEEIREIDNLANLLGLSERETKSIEVNAYSALIGAAKQDFRFTDEELESINSYAEHFGIEKQFLDRDINSLASYRAMYEIERGNLPTLPPPFGVPLKKKELVHWIERAKVYEEKVTKQYFVGKSSGFSFRIMKGVSYRIGSSRGHKVTETSSVCISVGDLIVTSQRLILAGKPISLEWPYSKIVNISPFFDGIELMIGSKKLITIRYDSGSKNTELIALLLSTIINQND